MRGRRIHYSAQEMTWLEANRTLVISDYFAAFRAAFPLTAATAAHLHGLRKRKGWKVGRAKGRLVGRHRLFSANEIAWLSSNATLAIAEYHRSFCIEFNRYDVTAQALHALRKRKGWKTGRTGRFEKGHVSANKGKPFPTAANHPNCRRTHFKKGQHPHNTKFAGHEHVRTDGYIEISVDETNPHTGFERRYVIKHRWLWEQKNGPVPEGHVLKCLDSNKQNTDPSNWEPVPQSIIPRLNGGVRKNLIAYDDAPDELKPTVLATAKLSHRAKAFRRAARKPQEKSHA